jgi:hypothetical protein
MLRKTTRTSVQLIRVENSDPLNMKQKFQSPQHSFQSPNNDSVVMGVIHKHSCMLVPSILLVDQKILPWYNCYKNTPKQHPNATA